VAWALLKMFAPHSSDGDRCFNARSSSQSDPVANAVNLHVLITGGSGFVGSNLAASLLAEGSRVTVLDSLARRGSEHNLRWLRRNSHQSRFNFVHADVRDFSILRETMADVDIVYHFAAQVAVTSSVDDPRLDFECNTVGTFNVLEAARSSGRHPILVFTSTNKVYGDMDDVKIARRETRYEYEDLAHGISESQPLDFHSPYGCSKGAADQYVRDYARIYNLRAVCFRMSCIYGPRQFGNEDQGWVAHFVIAAMTGRPITIYGDGRQVRDILFIDDLVRAFQLAAEKIGVTAGQIFNIGGGVNNTISVWHEFGAMLEALNGRKIAVEFSDWRPGDQRCYISDIRKAHALMGWTPLVSKDEGIRRLWDWVASNPEIFGREIESVRLSRAESTVADSMNR
jgi:CDP-paratose 2-epimerase